MDKKGEKKEAKKPKKGLFANFRKKLKSGGKKSEPVEAASVAVRGDVVESEGVKVVEVERGGGGGGEGSDEEREERERRELYNAIGYSEDEEYVEFPREVIFALH